MSDRKSSRRPNGSASEIRIVLDRMIRNFSNLRTIIDIALRQSHGRPRFRLVITHAALRINIRRAFIDSFIIISGADLYKLWKYDAAINSTGDITPTVCMCNGCGRYSPPKVKATVKARQSFFLMIPFICVPPTHPI